MELSSVEVQIASRRTWTIVSELLSFQVARGQRPEPSQLMPSAEARERRRVIALRLRRERGEYIAEIFGLWM